jgi:hypothetical protein
MPAIGSYPSLLLNQRITVSWPNALPATERVTAMTARIVPAKESLMLRITAFSLALAGILFDYESAADSNTAISKPAPILVIWREATHTSATE